MRLTIGEVVQFLLCGFPEGLRVEKKPAYLREVGFQLSLSAQFGLHPKLFKLFEAHLMNPDAIGTHLAWMHPVFGLEKAGTDVATFLKRLWHDESTPVISVHPMASFCHVLFSRFISNAENLSVLCASPVLHLKEHTWLALLASRGTQQAREVIACLAKSLPEYFNRFKDKMAAHGKRPIEYALQSQGECAADIALFFIDHTVRFDIEELYQTGCLAVNAVTMQVLAVLLERRHRVALAFQQARRGDLIFEEALYASDCDDDLLCRVSCEPDYWTFSGVFEKGVMRHSPSVLSLDSEHTYLTYAATSPLCEVSYLQSLRAVCSPFLFQQIERDNALSPLTAAGYAMLAFFESTDDGSRAKALAKWSYLALECGIITVLNFNTHPEEIPARLNAHVHSALDFFVEQKKIVLLPVIDEWLCFLTEENRAYVFAKIKSKAGSWWAAIRGDSSVRSLTPQIKRMPSIRNGASLFSPVKNKTEEGPVELQPVLAGAGDGTRLGLS